MVIARDRSFNAVEAAGSNPKPKLTQKVGTIRYRRVSMDSHSLLSRVVFGFRV